MLRRRYYLPGPGVVRRLVRWAWRHPYVAIVLAASAVLIQERGL